MPQNELEKHMGFKEDFIGPDGDGNPIIVPLPEIRDEEIGNVLYRDQLRDGCVADYLHYSLIMSVKTKQAFFSAANYDHSQYNNLKKRTWRVDTRIGYKIQVSPKAYKYNKWDRGHLTRFAAVTWGPDDISYQAGKDSCFYANASLQHEGFNQDEWHLPEEVAHSSTLSSNMRYSIITGPVFTKADRYFEYDGDKLARIPAAFWKIICLQNKDTKKLETKAYLMPHNDNFILNDDSDTVLELVNFQVTTTEIEKLTGLDFGAAVRESNKLHYNQSQGPDRFNTKELQEFEALRSALEDR